MQFKVFTIPIYGGEAVEEALNLFLRSHKILKTEHHLVQAPEGTSWCCFIQYLDGNSVAADDWQNRKPKVDYRAILNEEEFARFDRMRLWRRTLAKEEGVATYLIFNNAELAEIAKLGERPIAAQLRAIPGIGAGKMEKYGKLLIETLFTDDQSE